MTPAKTPVAAPPIDFQALREAMLRTAHMHGLKVEPGFDAHSPKPLAAAGRRFLVRIQHWMIASGKYPKVKASGILDAPTRAALIPPIRLRQRIVNAAASVYAQREHFPYDEIRPMFWAEMTPKPKTVSELLTKPSDDPWDCSDYATWCYFAAGAPDPNGNNFNGIGNTTTLQAHCREIPKSQAQPGDLALYTDPGHVGIWIGANDQIYSNGRYPMEILPYLYGHPFVGFFTCIQGDPA